MSTTRVPVPCDRLVPLSEFASRTNTSIYFARDLARRGEITTIKIGTRKGLPGGRHLVPESEIAAWIGRQLDSK